MRYLKRREQRSQYLVGARAEIPADVDNRRHRKLVAPSGAVTPGSKRRQGLEEQGDENIVVSHAPFAGRAQQRGVLLRVEAKGSEGIVAVLRHLETRPERAAAARDNSGQARQSLDKRRRVPAQQS